MTEPVPGVEPPHPTRPVRRTFQEAYYLYDDRAGRRWWRDLRLAGYLLRVSLVWLLRGSLVRWAHRRALRTGRPYYIDHLAERD